MRLYRCSSAILLLLLMISAIAGCHSGPYWPFAFNAKSEAPVQTSAAVSVPLAAPPTAQTAAATNDAISQQLAAESRALSDQYSVGASDPELEKYASLPDDKVGYSTASDPPRSGSFSSGSSSGCSSGCCR